jgi:hypothetical protein
MALSKEDACCKNVHVLESIGRDDGTEKINEFCGTERDWKF